MNVAKLSLDKCTWIHRGLNMDKCKNIKDAADRIKNAENVEVDFRPYQEDKKEIKKYMKRIVKIASISGHSYSDPNNQVIKGYVMTTMIVNLTKAV